MTIVSLSNQTRRSAFADLEALIEASGYDRQPIAIVPDELWNRLMREVCSNDVLNMHTDASRVIYKCCTMVLPESHILDCRRHSVNKTAM